MKDFSKLLRLMILHLPMKNLQTFYFLTEMKLNYDGLNYELVRHCPSLARKLLGII